MWTSPTTKKEKDDLTISLVGSSSRLLLLGVLKKISSEPHGPKIRWIDPKFQISDIFTISDISVRISKKLGFWIGCNSVFSKNCQRADSKILWPDLKILDQIRITIPLIRYPTLNNPTYYQLARGWNSATLYVVKLSSSMSLC